jgi:uncharacterized membrane protein YidH (DUF202 family)
MGIESKNRKSYIGFIVACVLIIVSVIILSGYRLWMVFTTDWSEVFHQMRPVDYLVTLLILVMLFAIRRWAKSKP